MERANPSVVSAGNASVSFDLQVPRPEVLRETTSDVGCRPPFQRSKGVAEMHHHRTHLAPQHSSSAKELLQVFAPRRARHGRGLQTASCSSTPQLRRRKFRAAGMAGRVTNPHVGCDGSIGSVESTFDYGPPPITPDDLIVDRTPFLLHDDMWTKSVEKRQEDLMAHKQRCRSFRYFSDGSAPSTDSCYDTMSSAATSIRESVDDSGDFFLATRDVDLLAVDIEKRVSDLFSALKLRKRYRAAEETEYPQYGGSAKGGKSSGHNSPVAAGDAKLASSAHLYHFENTKKQIIAMERSTCDVRDQESDDSEDEGENADYSVYECPGLAPTGDIEVQNPLFENGTPPNSAKGEAPVE